MSEFFHKLINFITSHLPRSLGEGLGLAIKAGLYLVLLTPLVVYSRTIYPALFPKAVYFRILVEIIFFLYVILVLLNKKYLPRITPLFLAVLIFIEVLMLTTFRGINPERSFWGSMERMEGLILFLHLFAFYIVAVGLLGGREKVINLLRGVVLVSFLLALAGLLEKLKINFFYSNPGDPRISSTTGNPVIYGNYLTILIFLAIFLAIFEKKRFLKIIFSLVATLNLVMLIFTGTRSAWAGVFFGGLVLSFFSFLFLGRNKEKRRMAFLVAIFFVLLFFLIFLLFSKLGYIQGSYMLDRYESFWNDLVTFDNGRFVVWKSGLSAWKDSPVFGYGFDSFSYNFDRYYTRDVLKSIPENLFFDRNHNGFIDLLVFSGILGLFSYLAVFATAILTSLRNRKKEEPMLSFILISLLVGQLVQNFFSFDTINTYVIIFFVFAFFDVFFQKERGGEDLKENEEKKKIYLKPRIILGLKSVIFLFFLITTIFLLKLNLNLLRVSIDLARAQSLMGSGKKEEAFSLMKRAENGPYFTRLETYYYSIEMIFYAEELDFYKNNKTELARELLTKTVPLENLLDKTADIFQTRGYMMLLRSYKGIYEIEKKDEYLLDEERIIGKAISFNPEYPGPYRFAGNMRFIQGRKEEAAVFFAKAFEIDKDLGNFYYWSGISFLETGEKAEAVEAFRKNLRFSNFYTKDKFNLGKVWSIAQMYEDLKDYRGMSSFYEEVLSRYPTTRPEPQIYASLSTVYAKMGDKKRAKETTYRMLQTYPELMGQAEQFLNNLDAIK